jgi:MFS transporter, YQGE family, putative transporter
MCKESKVLLLISTVFTLAMGMSGIFVNVFFWRETNSFVAIVIYNIMHYIFTPLSFIGAGWLAKRKNGIWSLRIGLIFFAVFFSLILFIGNRGVDFIYPLGILYGIAAGFYWLAFHTLCFDFTDLNNRDTFNGYNGSCTSIASAVAPISSGFIISRFQNFKGYYIVFIITLVLFVILILISMFLKSQNYGSKLIFSSIYKGNNPNWNNIRIATAIWGFKDVVIVFIINILIIKTTGSELALGEFGLIAALVSSAAFILVQKLIKPKRRRKSLFIGATFSFVAVFGLFIKVTYSTLLLYTLLEAFFLPFFMIQFSSVTFNVINISHEEKLRIEYIINKELVLNMGRLVSGSMLLLLLITINNTRVLNCFLIFIGVAPLAASLFIVRLKHVLQGN